MIKRLLFLTLFVTVISLVGCSSQEDMPKTFGFIFRYGVDAKNVLNTFEHKYIKDMVVDPQITIDLQLTNKQMVSIYQKLREIDFFNYPEDYNPEGSGGITPFSTFEFEVKAGKLSKKIHWDDVHLSKTRDAKKMRELIGLIIKMIEDSPEYKKLPEPRGGYL